MENIVVYWSVMHLCYSLCIIKSNWFFLGMWLCYTFWMRAFSPHYSYLIQLGLCGVEHIYDLLKKKSLWFQMVKLFVARNRSLSCNQWDQYDIQQTNE